MGRPRAFDHDEARLLHAGGASVYALAHRYGVSWPSVKRAVDPEFRERHDKLARDRLYATPCPDCGGPRNRFCERCHACAAKAQATSVRPGELLCFGCREWKPDDDFPSNRSETGRRRGRANYCRPCQTIGRRDRRRRNREADNAYHREYKRRVRSGYAGPPAADLLDWLEGQRASMSPNGRAA